MGCLSCFLDIWLLRLFFELMRAFDGQWQVGDLHGCGFFRFLLFLLYVLAFFAILEGRTGDGGCGK